VARQELDKDIPASIDIHWDELSQRDPGEIQRNALCAFHPPATYRLPLFSEPCDVNYEERMIIPAHGTSLKQPRFSYLVLLTYLLQAKDIPFSGKWVTEKELPGGDLFFRGLHALPKKELARAFGEDPKGFLEAGLALGGVPTQSGDASFRIHLLPRITWELILYRADEEFPADITVLMDSTASLHLRYDALWALAHMLVSRLTELKQG